MTGAVLFKSPTGIPGFDDVTLGGLPLGRPTLMCGAAGCGKTLFAMTFLAEGVLKYGEHGVLVSFEESAADLAANVASLGYDVNALIEEKKLAIDHVRIDPTVIEETGEYDLEGLFVRLDFAIRSVNAKRVVLDTLEALFATFPNPDLLRAELRRLFDWLKERGVTAIVTAERGAGGPGQLTRHGIEEYVSDCVILLDNRVENQVSTRRLRIVKYRGSAHGTNEYPFLIDESGISVIPITSLKLNYKTSTRIVSTGVPSLDVLFDGGGVYEGSSSLVTGTAGTAKTILAGHFAAGSGQRQERVLFFSFEESPDQLIRNMLSIGVDLRPFIDAGLLLIHASRPTLQGLEMHLLLFHKLMKEFDPRTVIVDPISSLVSVGSPLEVKAMLVRLMDSLKLKKINCLFTALIGQGGDAGNDPMVDTVSSLADNWFYLKNEVEGGRRQRMLSIVKSRGMEHYNDFIPFSITREGIKIASTQSHSRSKQTNGK